MSNGRNAYQLVLRIAPTIISGLFAFAGIMGSTKLILIIADPIWFILTFAAGIAAVFFLMFSMWRLLVGIAPITARRIIVTGISGFKIRRDFEGQIITIENFFDSIRKIMPSPKCKQHDIKISESFNSFNYSAQNNEQYAWLLPHLQPQLHSDYIGDYENLQLRYWTDIAAGSIGQQQDGLLNGSTYLFITWDFTNLGHWTPNRLQQSELGRFVETLGARSFDGSLFIHRVLIVPWGILYKSDEAQEHFKDNIWATLFEKWVNNNNPNYRLMVIDNNSLNVHTDPKDTELFRDVAFFSRDEKISQYAKDHGTPLPSPDEVGMRSYHAMQFSKRQNDMLLLFAAVLDQEEEDIQLNNNELFFNERREIVRGILDGVSQYRIDLEFKDLFDLDYHEI